MQCNALVMRSSEPFWFLRLLNWKAIPTLAHTAIENSNSKICKNQFLSIKSARCVLQWSSWHCWATCLELFSGIPHLPIFGVRVLVVSRPLDDLCICIWISVLISVSQHTSVLVARWPYMAIYGHQAIKPHATNMGKWGIPEKNYQKVAQQC